MTFTDEQDQDQGPGLSIDIAARLSATLDSMDGHLAAERRRRDRDSAMSPVFARFGRDVTVDATGIGFCNLGGPDQGHYWYVRSIVVGGIDPTIAALGLADIYVTSGSLGQSKGIYVPSLYDWRDRATRLPSIAFYGLGEMELRLNERLHVRFSGCTNAQQYAAVAQIEDHQEGPPSTTQTWQR